MTTVKITKREKLDTLINLLKGNLSFDDECVDCDMLIAFCEREKELLDKKAASAKKSAAKKKEERDELCDAVLAALTEDYASIPDIAAEVDHADATVGKVQSRLNKLAKAGLAEKAQATVEGAEGSKARKVVVYRLATAEVEVESED